MGSQDQELLLMFIEESREHLQQLETDLLSLEANPEDQELINRIFRAVHSLKGSSGFFGLKTITKLSHAMENVMSRVRDGEIKVTQQLVDVILAGGDKLNSMVDDVEHCDDVDITDELKILDELLQDTGSQAERKITLEAGGQAPDKTTIAQAFTIEETHIRAAVKRGRFLYAAKVYTHKDIKNKGKNPLDYIHKLESLGEFIDSYTDISDVGNLTDCLDIDIPFIFLFSTILEPDLVCMALEIPEEQIQTIPLDQYAPSEPQEETMERPPPEPSPAPEPALAARATQDAEPQHAPPDETSAATPVARDSESAKNALQTARIKGDETIRVSVSLLDDLMNLAGEMVLSRNQLLRMAEGLAHQVTGLPAVMQNINLVTSDLQEKVMKTRMQPVSNIFSKFNRILRDMSRSLNKEINLILTGEDVELDKTIIETLSDPLTHLVRNCADHGLETPEDREKAGKPRTGTVHLAARHEGGQVHIDIIDDGRGMNVEKIKTKAVDKGLITTEQARQLSDREAFSLIFMPGFSTADQISDISGRGVGMDVVRTNIEGLGGNVELESTPGKGTQVSLRLPLTLAIIPSMIVLAGKRRFAIPQVNLEELVRLDQDIRIESVRGADVMRLRGRLLPLVKLKDLLGEASCESETKEDLTKQADAAPAPETEAGEPQEKQQHFAADWSLDILRAHSGAGQTRAVVVSKAMRRLFERPSRVAGQFRGGEAPRDG
jgi:two-component system chemotaxis sensor kinase CheA